MSRTDPKRTPLSAVSNSAFVDPAAAASHRGVGPATTLGRRKYNAYAADDYDSMAASIPESNREAVFQASVVRAAQVQTDRHNALESMAWGRQCDQTMMHDTWPLPPSFPPSLNSSPGGYDSMSPGNGDNNHYNNYNMLFSDTALGDADDAAAADFDHELEFELNTAMGQTWAASLSKLPPQGGHAPLLHEPDRNFFCMPAENPDAASWSPHTTPSPFGPSGHGRPIMVDSPEDGFSPPEAIVHTADLGLRLEEKTRRDILSTTYSYR
jgi:hypothetical protein